MSSKAISNEGVNDFKDKFIAGYPNNMPSGILKLF